MRTTDIVTLTALLGPDIPYFVKVFGPERRENPPVLAECLQVTLADFALPWNMACSFAQAGLPLPDFPWPAAVHQAHRFCSATGCGDEDLETAYELQLPEHQEERDGIRGLLLTEATDERIAEVYQLRPRVIAYFEGLWWHVRDRRSELLYIAGLLDGQPNDFAGKLLRLGSWTRDCRLVLMAADLPIAAGQGGTDEDDMKQIEEFLVTEAAVGQALGCVTKRDNPALAVAEEFLLEAQAPPEDLDILTQLSLNKEAQRALKEVIMKRAEEILEACRKDQLGEGGGKEPNDSCKAPPNPGAPEGGDRRL